MSSNSSLSLSSTGSVESVNPVPIVSHSEHAEIEKVLTTSSLKDKQLQRPKGERRGIFSQLAVIPEFRDARDYPPTLKISIVFLIALAAVIGPMGTSIVFPAISEMEEDLKTTTMMVNVSVGIYLLALGVFPIWWSNFSERLGRRTVYITSFILNTGSCVGCALSPSINALIGFRVMSGACSASVQSVGAGTIADLYPPELRGRAMGYFYLGTLCSPLMSPIIGSLLLIKWDWRSTQWFMVALSATTSVLIIFLLPETLREQVNKEAIAKILRERRMNKEEPQDEEQIDRVVSRVSTRREDAYNLDAQSEIGQEGLEEVEQADAERFISNVNHELDQPTPTKWQEFKRHFYENIMRPWKALYFLQYPPVALSISFSAITFGVLYLMNITLEYEFARDPYNFKSLYIGLAYIPNSITYIIASVLGGRWTDKLYKDYKAKHGFAAAESRISYNLVSAVVAFPVALLIMGWCFEYHTMWVTPLIGSAIFGYATMMTIGPTVTYLVDSLPGRGATGVAVNNLVRQVFATAAVFLAEPMNKGMGAGPMCTLFAGVVCIWSVVLIILKRRGRYWRENFDLQKLYDKLE